MKSYISLIQNLTAKKVVAISSVSLILTTLFNMRQILLALGIIIMIDMLTGIRKSLFIKDVKISLTNEKFWQSIQSAGLRATWRKTYEYCLGIIAFIVIDSLVLKVSNFQLMGGNYTLSEIAVALACMVEIYSIYENMEAVSGNNILKKIIVFLPKTIRDILTKKGK